MRAVMLWAVAMVVLAAGGAAAQPAAGSGSPGQAAGSGEQPPRGLQRWIDWQAGTLETRYRYIETSEGETTSNQQQHRQVIRLRLKLDPEGRYSVTGGAATGGSLTSGWDDLGIGRGDPTWDISLRQLFVNARPVNWVDGEVGGLDATRGESTEITSYDNDAFVTGGRVRLRRPREIFFDEITVTAGRLDPRSPTNVFRRFDELDDHNFTQVIGSRRFGDRVRASVEWASLDGISTLRQAVRVDVGAWMPLDWIRFEQYQRVEGDTGYGMAIAVERGLTDRLTVGGGFASIDDGNPTINGDRYLRGRRVFGLGQYALLPDLTLSVFYTQALEDDFVIPNQHRFEIVLSFDVRRALLGARR